MTTATRPGTEVEWLAAYLVANADCRVHVDELIREGFTEQTIYGRIIDVRAEVRRAGFTLSWPTEASEWCYIATQNDDVRRLGDHTRNQHMLTHMREQLADYNVQRANAANATPVDVALVRSLQNAITGLSAGIDFIENHSDAYDIVVPLGAMRVRQGPRVRRTRVTLIP